MSTGKFEHHDFPTTKSFWELPDKIITFNAHYPALSPQEHKDLINLEQISLFVATFIAFS
jgi:hypothetical protein